MIFQKFLPLKCAMSKNLELNTIYSEKATKNVQNVQILFETTYLVRLKEFGDFVIFLWPSQNR